MIEIRDVRKAFGEREVLKGVSGIFETGKTSLIIGTSGSGKTVLMKCMVGLIKPTGGSVIYNHDVDFTLLDEDGRKEIRKQIGMLFQGTALFDSMSVEENILFPLNMFSDMSVKDKLNRVNFCLERVNLKGTNKLHPSELSGGMRKRVGIARAIVLNPKYLFCDEPNSSEMAGTSFWPDSSLQKINRNESHLEGGNVIQFILNSYSLIAGGTFLDFFQETGRKDKIIHFFNCAGKNFMTVAFPVFQALFWQMK